MTDWQSHDIYYQFGNIGSEIGRAMKWKGINVSRAEGAAERALELLDWSLSDANNRPFLKEIARIREVFTDSFYSDNQYGETTKSWDAYFLPYALAANR
ncbi:hypothetical protein A3A71_03735 [Candidatus Berkelbacteria bacterium RIFCSPLOWO2_01_FULL_50_28]|uniref:Uncharacterized protein n=1 Tax=Candidatus Berkelbacteria bacterium RIFCSPLOWO2_01_FULL_50_28 TaxID=1797471 RepID=A0A1F5EA90_9BACT|nr:MAG: hypothetical protein A3F39_01100 [Candidatus Berkelbacteria bacterium RIFCSPHIGHO2_12_FULL_50_11]OGD64261.1 MAG: hypothetical protein A3A71_03735 [Candidatus Berkelbacteria bacterium RIFCSPLOWO2_01_FULL_50_28]